MFKDERTRKGILIGIFFLLISLDGMISTFKTNHLYDAVQIEVLQQYNSYEDITPTYNEKLKLFITVDDYPKDNVTIPLQLKEREGKLISFYKSKSLTKESEVFHVFVDKNDFSYVRIDKGLYGKDR